MKIFQNISFYAYIFQNYHVAISARSYATKSDCLGNSDVRVSLHIERGRVVERGAGQFQMLLVSATVDTSNCCKSQLLKFFKHFLFQQLKFSTVFYFQQLKIEIFF